ncbi:hypothetical protein [Tenacibaculum ovolyticum]|uniref:hypothetical protein n=1 Tax=Tenacibaculum ovolyticum TaxID=104270 RepID=UPI0007EDDF73|nr:hypothetical protein [Tenacibaculum ovolyticum]
MKKIFLLIILTSFILTSCNDNLPEEVPVYSDNFFGEKHSSFVNFWGGDLRPINEQNPILKLSANARPEDTIKLSDISTIITIESNDEDMYFAYDIDFNNLIIDNKTTKGFFKTEFFKDSNGVNTTTLEYFDIYFKTLTKGKKEVTITIEFSTGEKHILNKKFTVI